MSYGNTELDSDFLSGSLLFEVMSLTSISSLDMSLASDSLELCFLGDDLLTSFEGFLFCGLCVLCVSFVSLLLLCFEPTVSVCVVSRGFFTGNALFLNRRLGLNDIGICL